MPVPAIFYAHHCESPVQSTRQVEQFYHNDFSKLPHPRDRRKKSPSVSGIIGGENRLGDQSRRDRRIKSPGVSPASVVNLYGFYDNALQTNRHAMASVVTLCRSGTHVKLPARMLGLFSLKVFLTGWKRIKQKKIRDIFLESVECNSSFILKRKYKRS